MVRLAPVRVEAGQEVESLAAEITGKRFIALELAILVLALHVGGKPVYRGQHHRAQIALQEDRVLTHPAFDPDSIFIASISITNSRSIWIVLMQECGVSTRTIVVLLLQGVLLYIYFN